MDSGSGLKNDREKGQNFSLHHYSKTIFTKAQEFNRSFSLHEYFRPMIGNKKEIFVADLGAGMFSTTGSAWDTAKVNLYPSDELADKYMDVLKQQRIKPLIPVEKQDMEQLTYPNEMFDIVHCANALDHCRSPFRAIGEMYRVCKKGGYIYLWHFKKVAKMMGLQYPGGALIEKLAKKGKMGKFNFPSPMIAKNNYNFSYSGLKTSVLYTIKKLRSYRNRKFRICKWISAGSSRNQVT